jgi:adenylate cyclase
MDQAQFQQLATWLVEQGLAGTEEGEIIAGLCERLTALGMPISRTIAAIDTLHPVHEGRLFAWQRDRRAAEITEYGRTTESEEAEGRWRRSPFYHLLQTGESVLRRRLVPDGEDEFPLFADMRAAGMTDYLAVVTRFGAAGVIGEMDCIYTSWTSGGPEGFSDADVDDLVRLIPTLSLALKSASLTRVAGTLVDTYLGHDAGQRVLSGRIERGVADRIDAVLWFSDLRDYTRLTETIEPEAIIPLLNAYSDKTVSAIHGEGGDVLKLMGDGILAIFRAGDRQAACRAALAAAEAAQRGIAALSAKRRGEDLPETDMYLALHVGKMFYGNIGSEERLDFTVVGPAVNEVSRIAAMCRSVDQPILVSSAFKEAVGEGEDRLISVGRFALRGVGQPQHLYTLARPAETP